MVKSTHHDSTEDYFFGRTEKFDQLIRTIKIENFVIIAIIVIILIFDINGCVQSSVQISNSPSAGTTEGNDNGVLERITEATRKLEIVTQSLEDTSVALEAPSEFDSLVLELKDLVTGQLGTAVQELSDTNSEFNSINRKFVRRIESALKEIDARVIAINENVANIGTEVAQTHKQLQATNPDSLPRKYRVSSDDLDRIIERAMARYSETARHTIDRVFVIQFENRESTLSLEALATLSYIANSRRGKGSEISIFGHANRKGDSDDNHELSRRRVFAVKGDLIKRGFKESNFVEVEVFGERRPLIEAPDDLALEYNRTVVVSVHYR